MLLKNHREILGYNIHGMAPISIPISSHESGDMFFFQEPKNSLDSVLLGMYEYKLCNRYVLSGCVWKHAVDQWMVSTFWKLKAISRVYLLHPRTWIQSRNTQSIQSVLSVEKDYQND